MELNKTQYDLVLELFQPEDVIIAKSKNRKICTSCSVSYNSSSYSIGKYNLPDSSPIINEQCDYCEGPLTRRPEDSLRSIKKRYFDYQVNQELLREYFTKKEKFIFFDLLHGVNDLHSLIGKIDDFFKS